MTIDNEVVSITFDNRQFEQNITETIRSLDKLRESLDFTNATRGIDEITSATNSFNMDGMAESIDNISSKFTALGAIGFSVIQSVTQGILGMVSKLATVAKVDILGPILTGGKQRSMNIEQAKFMFAGLGIDVEAGMKSALDAVLGTAFGLDEAAKAAAQFGASGIKVGDQMTSALRGVAGAAAMTGTSFTEMADIFAGSAGSGFVNNQDLMQFATRGLNAAAAIAPILHTTEAGVHELATNGELDFKTFANAMDQAFGKHATEANKTYAGSLSNLHAAMSRLGASFIGPRLEQERQIFNALSPVIDKVKDGLQPLIKAFTAIQQVPTDKIVKFLQELDFTNFNLAIPDFAAGIKNAFAGITQFFGVIKDAFRDIFPPSSVSILLIISGVFKGLTEQFKMGGETLDKVKNIFRGFFAIIEIGWTVIKELATVLFHIVQTLLPATGGLLSFGSAAGNMATKLNEALVAGGGIHRFFIRLDQIIMGFGRVITNITDKIVNFFNTVGDSKVAEAGLDRVTTRFENLKSLPDRVGAAWDRLRDRFQGVFDVLNKVGDYIKEWFGSLGKKIADAFKPGDFNSAVDIINVGLLGGIALMLKKFFTGGINIDIGGGFMLKISNIFTNLTKTLQTMQANLRADVLLKIAKAIALTALSLVALSLIDSVALTKALTAMAVGFGELGTMMVALDKIAGSAAGSVKISLLGGVLIAVASAMLILTAAIVILSKLDPKELAIGLAGIAGGLALLVSTTLLLSTNTEGLILGTAAIIGLSGALVLISGVVKIFSTMSLEELAKGLGAMAASLEILVGATLLMGKNPEGLIAGTAAIIGLSGALILISGVVKIFSTMSLGELAKGLGAMAIALGILVGATYLMSTDPAGLLAGAAAMILMAGALNLMAGAVLLLGQAGVDTLAKGIGAIAAILLILAVGLTAMEETLPGAAALIGAAGALLILTNVMEKLGKLSIAQIITGLAAMAAVMLVLSVAALALEPAIPALLGFGAALALIGVGFALFGVGAMLVAKSLEMLSKTGVVGIKALVEAIKVFLTAIPEFAGALVKSLVKFVSELVAAAPLLIRLIEALLIQLMQTITKLGPEIAKAIVTIIQEGLKLIREIFPDIIQTGYDLLIAFLQGIRDNIGEIITVVGEIVVAIITSLAANYQMFIDAGFAILTNMLLGIANNITKVIDAVVTIVTTFITALGDSATRLMTAGADALVKFLDGVKTNTQKLIDKGVEVAGALLDAIAGGIIKLTNKIGDVLVNFINGMAEAIRTHTTQLQDAGKNIAAAIIDGLTFGMAGKVKDVVDGAISVGKKAIGGLINVIKPGSPSKVTTKIGESMAQGLAYALSHDRTAENSAVVLAENILSKFQETLSQIPDSLAGMDEFNPVITPVLDLTKVQAASGDIGRFMKVSAITPVVSLDNARVLSAMSVFQNDSTNKDIPVNTGPADVKFEQNIYAPKALTTGDIYRNTKSQIVLAKEELGIS